MTGIGLSGILFSFTCGKEFLMLVYSSQWATDSCTLFFKAYSVYLLSCSMNGMSEAFAYGLANKEVLTKLQGLMLFNSVLYIGLNVGLSQYFGMVGLVYANCVNMFVRASLSLWISLSSTTYSEQISKLFSIVFRVLTHLYFLGLIALGVAGSFVAKYILTKVLKF